MTIEVGDYPVLTKYFLASGRTITSFENGLKFLNSAIAADGARKSDFKAIKENLNRVFEDAWGAAEGSYHEMTDAEKELHRTFGYRPECHTAKTYAKRLAAAKFKSAYTERLASLLVEMVPLADVVNQFKAKVIVREPKEDPVLAYQAPAASQKAQKAVYDLLVQITTDNYEKLVETLLESKMHILQAFETAQAGPEKVSPNSFSTIVVNGQRSPNIKYRDVLIAAFDSKDWYETDVVARKPNADAAILHLVKKEADYLRKVFLYKNMTKLDSILEAKADFDSAKIIRQEHGLLEGETRLTFIDGSAFTARTSIVYSYSTHGRGFTRYPLTFHDVVLANGKKRKMFSEEEMNTIFVGKQ